MAPLFGCAAPEAGDDSVADTEDAIRAAVTLGDLEGRWTYTSVTADYDALAAMLDCTPATEHEGALLDYSRATYAVGSARGGRASTEMQGEMRIHLCEGVPAMIVPGPTGLTLRQTAPSTFVQEASNGGRSDRFRARWLGPEALELAGLDAPSFVWRIRRTSRTNGR